MLVEDDNNLREIYGARLLAEGYEIVSAKDGEEALALAVKEKPDLIISDIMMPKISGFDMLDILRSTAETKETKVIMMTALSQVEDKDRADRLGADRYLIKSQVTLEDVAKAAREVLGEDGIPETTPTPTPVPVEMPVAVPPATPQPVATPTPVPTPVPDNSRVLADTIAAMGGTPTPTPGASTDPSVAPIQPTVMAPGEQSKTSVHTKVINPINDISEAGSNLQELLAAEEAKETIAQAPAPAPVDASSTPALTPIPSPSKPIPVVNDFTPPEMLQQQAEDAAEDAKLQPPPQAS